MHPENTKRRGNYLVYTSGNYRGKLVHRVEYRKAFGRIRKGYHVHHLDGDSLNNKPENLIAIPEEVHIRAHNQTSLPSRTELEKWERDWREKNPSKKKLKKLRRQKVLAEDHSLRIKRLARSDKEMIEDFLRARRNTDRITQISTDKDTST